MRTRALIACALAGLSTGVVASVADGNSGEANVQPTPRDVVWDNVAPGGAATKTVTMTNRGTAGGKVTRVRLTSADFRVVADRCTNVDLAPNATCGIDVEFRPSVAGTRVAHMRIDDTSACPEWVTLAGGGSKPVVARAAACQPVVQTVTDTRTVPGPTVTTPGGTTTTTTRTPGTTTGSSSSSRSKCVSRRKLTVTVKKRSDVTGVKATLAGKAMKVTKTSKGWRIAVDMSNLKNGRYALRITRERAGKKALTTVKRYSTCVPTRS